uniref:THAP-type domain-containing protein n=1 Tax=Neogobius melanostomus TaxID=47308 RepID=A0A8C6UNG6_9GOBI
MNSRGRSHDRRTNTKIEGLSFYGFPTWKQREGAHVADVTKRRRLAWIAAVGRSSIQFSNIPTYFMVCSKHFHSGKPAYEMNETDPDWAPTLLMGPSKVPASQSDRHGSWRTQQRAEVGDFQNGATENRSVAPAEVGDEALEMIVTGEDQQHTRQEMEAVDKGFVGQVEPMVEHANVENGDQTEGDLKAKRQRLDCEFCEQSRAEIKRLLEENRELRSELNKRELNHDFLKDDSEKVRYYTGLPCFSILFSLFSHVKSFLPAAKKLSPFQVLFLTLMRLRLDLPVQHLCHLFSVSHEALSSAFADTIDVLHVRLGPLVHWPGRRGLQATMPHEFAETFGKHVAIIVDCFEIRTERPSRLKASAQTYSQFKGTHTMKYLIGITPLGSISFVSKGWGGRTSNEDITEKCGLLNKLLPGDVVLAGGGFDVQNAAGMMCAKVKIPLFAKGLSQLDTKDIKASAHLRTHVERVVGSVHNRFKMLHTKIPIRLLLPCENEEMTLLDKLVNVCCILVNMCPSGVVKPKGK